MARHLRYLIPASGNRGSGTVSKEGDQLLSELYGELRQAAARMLRRDAPALTLQPTELVNEAALRIVRLERMTWHDRQHFFATSARIMRQAMMDAIRSRRRAKRQAPTILFSGYDEPDLDAELLDAALTKLEGVEPDLARIVELRFFVGLSIEEIAAISGTSNRTVKRRWQAARLWLLAEMSEAQGS